jgi:hypothetical protein
MLNALEVEVKWLDIDEVAPGLWQGGQPVDGVMLKPLFDAIVLMADEWQPRYLGGIDLIHAPIDDAERPPTSTELYHIKYAAARVMGLLRQGKRVLVTCMMGWNRSGVVTAMVLKMYFGLTTEEAIQLVRQTRGPNALSNEYFVRLVSNTPRSKYR